MSGAVNSLLSFLAGNYVVVLGGAIGFVVVLTILKVAFRRLPEPGQSYRSPGALGAGLRTAPIAGPASFEGETVSSGPLAAEERLRYLSLVQDLRADNQELRERVAHLKVRNSLLGPLVKELNSNVDRRRMGPLALRVMERMFNPKRALFFVADSDGETLTLTASHGVEGIQDGYQQLIGEGFAGVVAKKRVTLSRDDLKNESNLVRQKYEGRDPKEFGTELAAPIIYRERVLGVLCMGGLSENAWEAKPLLGIVADVTALALTNYMQYRKIQEFANSDPLTGIYNKGYFLTRGAEEVEKAKAAGCGLSLLMFDVDHFKHYNDTNGHLAGDGVLKALAAILRGELRDEDVIARFGGEEFVAILPGVAPGDGVIVAERIRSAVAAKDFEHGEKQPLGCVSVSIGVASMPEQGVHLEDVMERADQALYKAKAQGRNQVFRAGRSNGARELVEN